MRARVPCSDMGDFPLRVNFALFDNLPIFPIETPALRAVEMTPVQVQGQHMILVRDPAGVIEGAALLVPDPLLIYFFQMADGQTTLGEMAQKATMNTGQIIPAGMFESMAKQLDDALLLQSEKFRAALIRKYEQFMESPTRPCKTMQANGADRLAMMKQVGDEFRRHRMSSISPPQAMDLPMGSVNAILCPHIDYARGGEVYAWAYRALKEHGTGARTFIILGTNHRHTHNRFIGTRKNFDTPFGVVETDQALVNEIATAYGDDFFREEYVHADEHTIELQAVYLKQIFADEPIRIVPILVGSFDDLLETAGSPPGQDEEISRFTKILRDVLDKHGDKVALIGGVDLSHCGPEFGDEQVNDDARVKEVEARDMTAIAAIESGDPDAFFDVYRDDLNAFKVCSIGTIYCVLAAMRGRGTPKVLKYNQANSTDKNCLVSFASIAFIKSGAEAKPKSRIILLNT
ncbi:AmmeMemoRadiSam system protein B [Candidatus Sumerlaeota bacterium]|nr:AmmeMemoRadiSam system protein B [Candidatus Sumerlaeota bacterium]